MDGVSLAPLLAAHGQFAARRVVLALSALQQSGRRAGGAVRAGDYKLIEFYEDGRLELYNLARDIGERADLAKSEAKRAARMREMLVRLAEIGERTHAGGEPEVRSGDGGPGADGGESGSGEGVGAPECGLDAETRSRGGRRGRKPSQDLTAPSERRPQRKLAVAPAGR